MLPGPIGHTNHLSRPSPGLKNHRRFPSSLAHLDHSHPLHRKDGLLPPPACSAACFYISSFRIAKIML